MLPVTVTATVAVTTDGAQQVILSNATKHAIVKLLLMSHVALHAAAMAAAVTLGIQVYVCDLMAQT